MKHLRHFVTVGERQLHFRHAGSGPPLVLLHACPKSSAEQAPLVDRLSNRFSVMAFDIPGYGDSDPVSHERPEIADFATDLAAALDVLGVSSCSIYGRHTGGLIALEFGDRFPERLDSAIFDGFPVFSDEERRRFLSGYLQPLIPLWDGLHLPGLWSRMRENYLFFPWNEGPDPAHRNDLSMPPASQLHATAIDMLKIMDRWRLGYASAFRYRPQSALARVDYPALIMARRDDLLYPHLQRLPELPAAISVEPHSYDVEAWAACIEAFFDRTARGAMPPPPNAPIPVASRPWSSFVEPAGARLRIRRTGDGPAEYLILHDIPGSSAIEEPLLRALPGPAIAPDLPGTGLSAANGAGADRLVEIICALAREHASPGFTFMARGLSAELGLKASQRMENVGRLVLVRPLFVPPAEADFASRHVAVSEPDDEGTHLTRLWYAARDGELYWPWYERRREHIRRGERRLDPAYLTARVVAMAENMQGYRGLVGDLERLHRAAGDRVATDTAILLDDDSIGNVMAQQACAELAHPALVLPTAPTLEAEIEQLRRLRPLNG